MGEAEAARLFDVRHVSIAIARPPSDVYAFASKMENLSRWATGIGTVRHEAGEWIAEGPLGRIRLRFAEPNAFGVLDHDVTLPGGETFHNPMRVVPNGTGSEVTFVLVRQAEMTDDAFDADARTVLGDLHRLKSLLEDAGSR